MSIVSHLPFVSAVFGGLIALAGIIWARRSVSDWAFIAGMSQQSAVSGQL